MAAGEEGGIALTRKLVPKGSFMACPRLAHDPENLLSMDDLARSRTWAQDKPVSSKKSCKNMRLVKSKQG